MSLLPDDILRPEFLVAVAAVVVAGSWWIYQLDHKKCPPGMTSNEGSFIITVPAVDNDSRAFQEARRDFTRAVKSGNVLVVVNGKRVPSLPEIPSDLTEERWHEVATSLLKLCHLDSTALANISPRLPQLVNTSLGIEFTKGVGLPVALFQPK
ncbi:hypothetical protein FOZ62_026486 [Perkinsus olseni]|nr:hypothetical protein FOZ62_026486 [Perkinsus olseni]